MIIYLSLIRTFVVKNSVISAIFMIAPGIGYLHEKYEEEESPRLREFLAENLKKYTFRSTVLVINQKAIPFSSFYFS